MKGILLTISPAPFRIAVAASQLDDLRRRIDETRWPDQLPGAGWSYGVDAEWLRDLVSYWRDGYDWRVHEAALNAYPQFTVPIDGENIHFLHVRSPEPDATPMILSHGWPSTVADFLSIIDPLINPVAHGGNAEDAFHLVIPSLPGYGFSGPTHDRGWGVRRTARAWAELMDTLGYDRYVIQGGDFGSVISPELARQVPERVIGLHVNAVAFAASAMHPGELELLSADDREQAIRNEQWWYGRAGYMHQMGTRPQTLAYALNDSPVGQLAWNAEWYVDYDPAATTQTPVDRDALLTNATIFWLTGTAGSAARMYYELGPELASGRPAPAPVPTAIANFAGDHVFRELVDLSHNVTRWRSYDTGGHFAALQAPGVLVDDIREFRRELRAGTANQEGQR